MEFKDIGEGIGREARRVAAFVLAIWRDNDACISVDGIYSIFHPAYNELMAGGLYHLGPEDETILGELPPLTMHEKLGLRLSMSREFWPQTWGTEEGKSPDLERASGID